MRKLDAPPAELRFRRMVEADLDAVMEVQRDSFTHPWSRELFKRELDHEWSTVLLAESPTDGTLVGLIIFWLVHDELHILNVAVRPTCRRQGVANRLLAEALAVARSKKCVLATLEVRKTNEPALTLYKNLGFRPVGLRPNYYVDEGEDAVVMVLDL